MVSSITVTSTFTVQASQDVVRVEWEEASVVEHCCQELCHSATRHGLVMLMLVNLTKSGEQVDYILFLIKAMPIESLLQQTDHPTLAFENITGHHAHSKTS